MDDKEKKVEWVAMEYAYQEKTPDWFWALGIIALSTSIISIIYKNYLFAIFIILAAVALTFVGIRKPKAIRFTINKDGVKVDDRLYPYKNLKSFWIHESEKEKNLLVMSDSALLPLMSLPLMEDSPIAELREILLAYIPEERLEEPASHKIMEYLGF